MAKTAKTVDEYLNQISPKARKSLEQLRKAIKSAAPKTEELISYRIPLYKYKGHLTAFMAAKNHVSFVTMSVPLVKSLKNELKPYKVSGTTIHFPYDKPIPATLVKKIMKARMKENEEKAKGKSKK
ncbi:MAG: DUF1801 domain-containing protein [Chlorobi bacterium]|nr:DUF1801 domain-containing protein [Chlorobiota bacterium]MCI0716364.1 DUF1801 domain-containing protein [Chlorobiota bacterium]